MRRALLPLLLAAGCSGPVPNADSPSGRSPSPEPSIPPSRGPEPTPPPQVVADDAFDWSACVGRAPSATEIPWDLVRIEPERVRASSSARLIEDGFRRPALNVLRDAPLAAPCLEQAFAPAPRPSQMIATAASAMGQPARGAFEAPGSAAQALDLLCPNGCAPEEVSPALEALAPVLWAIVEALGTVEAHDEPVRGPSWWSTHGGNGLLADSGEMAHYNAAFASDRSYLEAERGTLYGAAVHLARALEEVDWAELRAMDSAELRIDTPSGPIGIFGTGDDAHPQERWLLLVDLGGRDLHLHSAGGTGPDHPVSVVVDVEGDDVYAYPEWTDASGARMPPDDAGRDGIPPHIVDASASDFGRQGAAFGGIAIAFDLSGDDIYRSLRGSQGYAHHGVGVLYDASGDDDYRAETASQGAGQYGIGILIDADGRDAYESMVRSQGHGFVGGVGWLSDTKGDDAFICRHHQDGPLVYPAPQLPGEAQASLCQGAGFGFRNGDPAYALSGGFGVLTDQAGDDVYEAEVYGQGVGYWQGIGLLSDRAGDDVRRVLYYGQGAGVHFGVGVMIDRAGRDAYEGDATLSLGAGHDFGLGLALELDGDDVYALGPNGGGGGSCGGLGVLWDARGNDTYQLSGPGLGRARAGGCASAESRGVFLDSEGADTYGDAGLEGAHRFDDDEGHRGWAQDTELEGVDL